MHAKLTAAHTLSHILSTCETLRDVANQQPGEPKCNRKRAEEAADDERAFESQLFLRVFDE